MGIVRYFMESHSEIVTGKMQENFRVGGGGWGVLHSQARQELRVYVVL
jgi:hypothetical protein